MSFEEKTREVAGLFELSMDEEDENLNKNDLIFEISSKLKSKKKTKSPKRLKASVKTDLNEDDDEDDDDVYDFKSEKKLTKTSTKKSRSIPANSSPKTALKSIENKNQSSTVVIAASSRKRPYRLISNDTTEDQKEEFEQLAEKYQEISNYKLVVD